MIESGEVLVRRLPRRSTSRLEVPLQLQVLEIDLLDSARTQSLVDGGRIIQGVELDGEGGRRAYWLLPDHPGELLLPGRGWGASTAFPAAGFAHLYEKLRPGQLRGVPWLAPVIRKLRDLDDYEEAELVRKKIEASRHRYPCSAPARARMGSRPRWSMPTASGSRASSPA